MKYYVECKVRYKTGHTRTHILRNATEIDTVMDVFKAREFAIVSVTFSHKLTKASQFVNHP